MSLALTAFIKTPDRIVRVYAAFTREGVAGAWVQTPTPLASFLQNKFPEIDKTVRISRLPKGLVSSGDKNFYEERILIADSTIFEVFSFPLIIGNPTLSTCTT